MAEKTEHRYLILTVLRSFFRKLKGALSDLLPIIVVITVFQLAILRQPFPELLEVLMGVALVIIGLMLFVQGLEMGLFPIGEALAVAFARKGSLVWVIDLWIRPGVFDHRGRACPDCHHPGSR